MTDVAMQMKRIDDAIKLAQQQFGDLLANRLPTGHVNMPQYVRYLTLQYHLTRGVQYYFMTIAAHSDLARRRPLRKFLVNFANEEELHYLVAANDLAKLNLVPLPAPFDVELWHAYWRSIILDRPFLRLGAACILENISAGAARTHVNRALSAPFITKENSKFLVLHKHDTLPHGDQVLDAIEHGNLEDRHFDDLVEGAGKGTLLYLRMADWALAAQPSDEEAAKDDSTIESGELTRIRTFEMSELDD